jgi:SAM-dependent methyltransferase
VTLAVDLINPYSGRSLRPVSAGLIDEDGRRFPLTNGIYRIVDDESYARSFGLQWNRYGKTQLDRIRQGYAQSRDRFFAATGWRPEELRGMKVLEAGSGAGRFTQVVLDHTEAELYSVDVSRAVEANFGNNGPHERLHLFQADLYELPFAEGQFDKVFCFGVLQHTPDPKRTVASLARMLAPGGELVLDFYAIRAWHSRLQIKYLLRPITKRMDPAKLHRLIEANVGRLIAAHRSAVRLGIGRIAKRLIPVCDIEDTLPPDLDERALAEWVALDTFDMLSPWHDRPERVETVAGWFRALGLGDVRSGMIRYGAKNQVAVVRGARARG